MHRTLPQRELGSWAALSLFLIFSSFQSYICLFPTYQKISCDKSDAVELGWDLKAYLFSCSPPGRKGLHSEQMGGLLSVFTPEIPCHQQKCVGNYACHLLCISFPSAGFSWALSSLPFPCTDIKTFWSICWAERELTSIKKQHKKHQTSWSVNADNSPKEFLMQRTPPLKIFCLRGLQPSHLTPHQGCL